MSELPGLDGPPEHKLEYIRQLIALGADDIRQVTLYISASFVVTAVLLSSVLPDDLADLAGWLRATFFVGILSLAAGALLFFRYTRKLHLTRMSLARCIPTVDAARARELWTGVWRVHGREYAGGLVFFGLGLVLQAVVLAGALLSA